MRLYRKGQFKTAIHQHFNQTVSLRLIKKITGFLGYKMLKNLTRHCTFVYTVSCGNCYYH